MEGKRKGDREGGWEGEKYRKGQREVERLMC